MHAPPSPAPRELVLFLPAVGGDSSFWAPQVEALAGAYEVRALDFTRPAAEVSIEAYADDVAAAIAAAGFACAHVVGCSMGGVVALALAARHPRRVRSLTLVASWAHQADGAARLAWFEGELSQKTVAEFSQATMPALFAPATDPALVARCVARESAKDHAVYRASWRAMLTADMRPALPTLSAPLLLVGGALDPVTPADPLLTDIAAAVPTARLEVLAAGSHFLNLDCPAAFNELLRGHLRGAKARVSDRLTPVEPGAWTLPATATATQLIALLGQRGVELLAANSGTDFTPIIEAYAELSEAPGPLPRLVQCPHEATAIALAHGHALISRRAQAVMGHVGVGTANMGLGIINARRAQVPMLVLAGRTPHYEEGLPGVRTNFVQWGQDTRDQGAYFREFTRWDYELRGPHALDTVIDRALAIAESDPRGPVYLTLPKEPLCAPAPARTIAVEPAQEVAHAGPADALALARARTWIAASRRTLVITADVGRHVGAPEALVRFSRAARAGVVEFGKRNFFNFPTEDPHHLGFDPHALLADVELVIAIECPVPWIPAFAGGARPRTIQLGVDPLCADLPMRGFPCDLALAGDPVATLWALAEGGPTTPDPALARRHATIFDEARRAARADATREVITKRYLSHMIGQVIDDDVIIVNEYNLDPTQVPRRCADSWFENSVASGLGWSLGAALGIKLAARERTVVTTLGDGSYLFNAPLSAHYVAADLAIPTLTVIFNDRAWSTIKKSTRGGHPGGFADRSGQFALCDFGHALDFAAIAAACGLSGRRVTAPAELRATLEGALADVRAGASVLVDVACERDA